MNDSRKRYIRLSDTMKLITKAGGRCSYNHKGEICNKLLCNGMVNIGERAHIVGVNGPRSDNSLKVDQINDYENLIWLCRDHHKIVDDRNNIKEYSVEILRNMKQRHEGRVENGRYSIDDDSYSVNDYSVLSCLFLYIDINRIYYSAASFPVINETFFEIGEILDAFDENNPGKLKLKDPLLNFILGSFIERHRNLERFLLRSQSETIDADSSRFRINMDGGTGMEINYQSESSWKKKGDDLVLEYLYSVEQLKALIGRRFPEITHQDVFDPLEYLGLR